MLAILDFVCTIDDPSRIIAIEGTRVKDGEFEEVFSEIVKPEPRYALSKSNQFSTKVTAEEVAEGIPLAAAMNDLVVFLEPVKEIVIWGDDVIRALENEKENCPEEVQELLYIMKEKNIVDLSDSFKGLTLAEALAIEGVRKAEGVIVKTYDLWNLHEKLKGGSQ